MRYLTCILISTVILLAQKKYILSEDQKSLTIVNLRKENATLCVQCMVENKYGLTMKNGCIRLAGKCTFIYVYL